MKIFVERVLRHTQANTAKAGSVGTSVEVFVRAISGSEADALAWESAVGKTLSVYEGDLVPGASDG